MSVLNGNKYSCEARTTRGVHLQAARSLSQPSSVPIATANSNVFSAGAQRTRAHQSLPACWFEPRDNAFLLTFIVLTFIGLFCTRFLRYYIPVIALTLVHCSFADSEDSDAEGGLGNVSKLVIRPPGHSGKAKKGHLCFDASFETGNLGRVDLVSEFEYDLFIRPDTCSPRLRLWFNFTVDNVRQDQRVIFNIVNISKSKNLFRQGLTPLVRSSNRHKWQRLPHNQVFYYRSIQHQDHYVLSFAFSFDREDELYQFALTYPYSFTRHLSHLDNLTNKYVSELKSMHNNKIFLLNYLRDNQYVNLSSDVNQIIFANILNRFKL